MYIVAIILVLLIQAGIMLLIYTSRGGEIFIYLFLYNFSIYIAAYIVSIIAFAFIINWVANKYSIIAWIMSVIIPIIALMFPLLSKTIYRAIVIIPIIIMFYQSIIRVSIYNNINNYYKWRHPRLCLLLP